MSKRTSIWDDHSLVPNTTAALVLGMRHVAWLNFGAESHLERGLDARLTDGACKAGPRHAASIRQSNHVTRVPSFLLAGENSAGESEAGRGARRVGSPGLSPPVPGSLAQLVHELHRCFFLCDTPFTPAFILDTMPWWSRHKKKGDEVLRPNGQNPIIRQTRDESSSSRRETVYSLPVSVTSDSGGSSRGYPPALDLPKTLVERTRAVNGPVATSETLQNYSARSTWRCATPVQTRRTRIVIGIDFGTTCVTCCS
jgi:hypothetical protein